MIHVAIDARLYGTQHAGIGRYVQNLVEQLTKSSEKLRLTLFIHSKHSDKFKTMSQVNIIECQTPHYTFQEQIQFLRLLNSQDFDLLHVPHFNVPVLYNRPFVVTIHDILWHQVRGSSVTTLSPLMYHAKYVGYRLSVLNSVLRSRAVITPSNYVKDELIGQYGSLKSDKVEVIYEGADHQKWKSGSGKNPMNESPFFLYTGSCYPHKNVETLIRAMSELKQIGRKEKLVIVSSRNVFTSKLKALIKSLDLDQQVIFTGYVPDEELYSYYQHATALVHPSLSEGFGLTGLEAMIAGCPVISSSRGSLPEVYEDAAYYLTSPKDHKSMAAIMIKVADEPSVKSKLVSKGKRQAAKYRWKDAATKTISIYQKVAREIY